MVCPPLEVLPARYIAMSLQIFSQVVLLNLLIAKINDAYAKIKAPSPGSLFLLFRCLTLFFLLSGVVAPLLQLPAGAHPYRVRDHRPGPLLHPRRPLAALAETLERLHDKGLVHRDLRPENALFRTPSDPVWIDFQVALPRGTPARPWGPGTWAYASPEQRKGLSADLRDDVYSFGMLLLHMLSGELPDSAAELAAVPPKAEDVPPALTAWLRAALAPSRSARPASLGEVAGILRAH